MSVHKLKSKPNSKPKPYVKTTVLIDRKVWATVKALATEKGIDANDFAVLGIELLLELAAAGYIPDDLGYMLERRNPELLRRLITIIRGD